MLKASKSRVGVILIGGTTVNREKGLSKPFSRGLARKTPLDKKGLETPFSILKTPIKKRTRPRGAVILFCSVFKLPRKYSQTSKLKKLYAE